MVYRIREVTGRVARVDGGVWSGDPSLAALGEALEPLGGVSGAFPDPDYVRALALAARLPGGEVLGSPRESAPPSGAVE